jgi:hypothetical protein
MTRLSPDVLDLKRELGRAIRADCARRARRRRTARRGAAAAGAAVLLSSAGVAGAAALGVIDLGSGVSATPVTNFPQWNGQAWSLSAGGANAPFVYHLTGGHAAGVGCGPGDPNPTNNIYITSTRQLTTGELHHISNVVATGLTPNATIAVPGVTSIRNASCPGSVIVLSPGRPGA